MGLFSIFKPKKNPSEADASVDSQLLRGEPTRMVGLETEAERARQREIARATAMKIDAIELAMTSDIFDDEEAWGKQRTRARPAPSADNPTLPMMELATTELLGEDFGDAPVEAEAAPVMEEIAILYANGEEGMAEPMLSAALGDDRAVWWMLFDLYQLTGKQEAFDSAAIDYASRFETSPPTWNPPTARADTQASGVAPTESFGALLDASIAPQLERLRGLAAGTPAFRLEFGQVRDVTPEGCALLLAALKDLRKRERQLMVAGVAELAALLRSVVEIGKREAAEAPWLLLLELLQLMNREKEFEETAMDYCVTYEVSPPQFEAPKHVAAAAPARAASPSDRFLLPAVVEGAAPAVLDAIDVYVSQYDPAILDCSQLRRIDYAAASALLNRLRALAAEDKKIEMRDMNHLVAALCKLLGYAEVVRLFPHKY